MTLDNVHHALEIQNQSYPSGYTESEEAFESMAEHYGSYSFLMQVDALDNLPMIGGYIVSHPGVRGKAQPLDQPASPLTGAEDCWYLHDCCLAPQFQGKGLAKRMVQQVEQLALNSGYHVICLVSVQNTYPVWQKAGYRILKKFDYGGLEAFYMEKTLVDNVDSQNPGSC